MIKVSLGFFLGLMVASAVAASRDFVFRSGTGEGAVFAVQRDAGGTLRWECAEKSETK